MDQTQQDNPSLSSPESSQTSPISLSIPPSNYLTVPSTRPLRLSRPLRPSSSIEFETPEPLFVPGTPSSSIISPSEVPVSTSDPIGRSVSKSPRPPRSPSRGFSPYQRPILMSSVYSAASESSEHSEYSNPPARTYRVPSFSAMSGFRKITIVCNADSLLNRFTHLVTDHC